MRWQGWAEVAPVINEKVRSLCSQPYPRHPKGCPNYDKRSSCPPQAPMLWDVLDLMKPVWCIWNRFNLAAHVDWMRHRHPDWSWAQWSCCLYWQGTARKQLRKVIARFQERHYNCHVIMVPEAMGVNVTATIRQCGITLEWPPKTTTYQVALAGSRKEKR